MKIVHTQMFTDAGQLEEVVIEIQDGIIAGIHPGKDRIAQTDTDLDARGSIVSPGWIDIQINGGFGCDFTSDPETIWEVAEKLPRFGITGFLPTIITSVEETYRKAIAVMKAGPPAGWRGARPFGLHFEGPFLNLARKGAHNPDWLHEPDGAFIEGWSRENGVLLVTMAPELPGAAAVAAELLIHHVVLSAGHTAASLSDAQLAIESGFTAVTHLFNAMPPLDHRSPGIICEALLNPRISAGLIADGLHVHPRMVELVWKLKGSEKTILVSDAVGVLGMPPGKFIQGGMEIIVDEKSARLTNGTLAGSVLGLDQALRNVMAFTGAHLQDVLPALSRNPARLLRLEQNGSLTAGKYADLTFIQPDGQVLMTIVNGEVVFES